MKRPFWYLAVAALSVGLLFAGCGQREPSSSKAAPSSARPAKSDTVRYAVTLPALDDLQPAVRAQLEQQHARVRALETRPGADPAALGEAYGVMGQLLLAYAFDEPAARALHNAEALLAEDARWPYYLGYLFQRTHDPDAARQSYERASALEPNDVPTRIHLAEVYRDLNRTTEAQTVLEETLRLDPRNAAAHYLLGQLAGSTSDAIAHYEAALRLQPNASVVHYPLGLAYRTQGNLERSRELLARRGDTNIQLTDPLRQQLDGLKQGPEADLFKGSRLMSQRRFEEAAAAFERVVAEDPDNVDGYLNLGAALAQIGRVEEAIVALQQALRLDPANSKAAFNLGVLYAGRGDDDEARALFQAALEADPAYTSAHYALSKLYWRRHQCAEALPHFAAYLAATPDHLEVRLNLAICHSETKAYAEAQGVLEEGLQAFPNNPGLQDALVRILAASPDERVRDGQRALEMAEPLVRILRRTETLESLAMAYAEQRRFEEAVQTQQAAIQATQQQGLTTWLAHLNANLERYQQNLPCRRPWEAVVFER